LIDQHPLAGAGQTFSFEALFRPDGGAFGPALVPPERGRSRRREQPPATRFLFEIRTKDGQLVAGRLRHRAGLQADT
jgi:hypothetical protein